MWMSANTWKTVIFALVMFLLGTSATAQDLKLSVVGEGIETLESWRALRDLGCDMGQGYFIARPMPGEQVAEWAKQDRSHLRD